MCPPGFPHQDPKARSRKKSSPEKVDDVSAKVSEHLGGMALGRPPGVLGTNPAAGDTVRARLTASR